MRMELKKRILFKDIIVRMTELNWKYQNVKLLRLKL